MIKETDQKKTEKKKRRKRSYISFIIVFTQIERTKSFNT